MLTASPSNVNRLRGGVELRRFIVDARVGIRDGAALVAEVRRVGVDDLRLVAPDPAALDSAPGSNRRIAVAGD